MLVDRRDISPAASFGITSANPSTGSLSMRSNSTIRRDAVSPRKLGLSALILFCCAATFVSAQDAIRPSLAGEAASEARRQSIDRIPYNLMVGPFRFRVSATAGIEYN